MNWPAGAHWPTSQPATATPGKSCSPGPPIWWLELGTHADTSGQQALTGGSFTSFTHTHWGVKGRGSSSFLWPAAGLTSGFSSGFSKEFAQSQPAAIFMISYLGIIWLHPQSSYYDLIHLSSSLTNDDFLLLVLTRSFTVWVVSYSVMPVPL